MMAQPNILRVAIKECEHGMLEARLVELKIVVAGRDPGQLLEEISHAIECHYEHAKANGLVPFASLFRDSRDLFTQGTERELGRIALSDEAAYALATALHAPNPKDLHIKSIKVAA